ncbi:MAG: ABC transporter permease [Flavisolibacter sp.]|nr:ABC transporter permease [Flavisolibacter sp.]
MGNLLKTEWLKLKKYWAFWWMTGIIAFIYPGMNYFMYSQVYKDQLKNPTIGPLLRMIPNPFTFPEVWHTVAYISSWFVFIPSIVVIMFITNEYTYKTHRQNIIDGWSRTQFLVSKMVDVLLISFLATILLFIVTLVIGYVNINEKTGNIWAETKYIGLFFLQTFSQLSLAFLIAFLVRKAFIALGIFLFYFFAEAIFVEFARHKLNDIGRYMPMDISDRLVPLPRFFVRSEVQWNELMSQINSHLFYTALLIALTWGICFWINAKRDL